MPCGHLPFLQKSAFIVAEPGPKHNEPGLFCRPQPPVDRFPSANGSCQPQNVVCGDSYRCVWAIKEYPPTTEELALFSTLADRNNLTIHLYSRMVDAIEQRKIIQNATRKNKLSTGSNDVQENITAEGNLEDVVNLIAELRKNKKFD